MGRLVAEEALQESVDWVMGYIAQDPAVRALVQQQAIGFSEEVTVGARERMITGDNILEGVVRRILGRKPRAELPGPPDEVQKQASLMAEEEQAPSP